MSNDDIQALMIAARDAARAAKAADAALGAACERASPIQVGDVIRSRTGKLAKVTRLRVGWMGDVQLLGVLQKKDGTFGVRKVSTYSAEWDDAEKVG